MEGVAHSVEVTAATLYEAVALGLRELQGNEWVEGITRGLNTVGVSVKNVQVEHTVTIGGSLRSGLSGGVALRLR
jgi:hypothetical protein